MSPGSVYLRAAFAAQDLDYLNSTTPEPATLTSYSSQAFIIETRLFKSTNKALPSLIDSGASKSFIDEDESRNYQNQLKKFDIPIPLTLFDGGASSSGEITYYLDARLVFDDGTLHYERLLVTRLHPSAKIVLGLPWLRKYNPPINWTDLSINFGGVKLAATIIRNFDMLAARSLTSSYPKQNLNKVTIEEVPEVYERCPDLCLGLSGPILQHISETEDDVDTPSGELQPEEGGVIGQGYQKLSQMNPQLPQQHQLKAKT